MSDACAATLGLAADSLREPAALLEALASGSSAFTVIGRSLQKIVGTLNTACQLDDDLGEFEAQAASVMQGWSDDERKIYAERLSRLAWLKNVVSLLKSIAVRPQSSSKLNIPSSLS